MDSGSSGTINDHNSPTLNDILSQHGLREEHFQKKCPQKVRLAIAKKLKDWKMLGQYLNIPEEDLTAINRENDTEDLRRVAMLNTWHRREGSNATYLKLANALHQHGRRDLVESLCHAVKTIVRAANTGPQSRNEAMFRSNEENIKSKFAILLQRVRFALEANHVTIEEVRTILVGMFADSDNCIPKTNLEEIISAATKEGLWDYMHHSPVEELLCNLIPQHKSLISQYKEHLSGYEATTMLIDYIKYSKGGSRRAGSNEIPLGNYNKRHYQRLTVKLDTDRNITLLSLKYVQDLWERFAEEFHIPFLTVLLNKIGKGCIEITWLVSRDVAEKIAVSANKSMRFFRENKIVWVAVDDNPIYDQLQVSRCIADFTSKLKRGISQYCRRKNLEQASIPEKDVTNLVDQHVKFDRIMEQDLVSNKQSYVVSVKSDTTFHHATCRSQDTLKADTNEQVKEGTTTIRQRLATGIPFVGFFYGFLAGLVAILCGQEEVYRIIAEIILAGVLTGVVTVAIIDRIRDLNIHFFQQISLVIVTILMIAYPPIIIIALVKNLTGTIAGATVGDYSRAAMVGIITGAIVAAFDKQVAKTLIKIAEKYTDILFIASVLLQGIFGIYILISIVAATAGAYVGAAIYISIIGCVVGASGAAISSMVRTVSKAIAIGAFIGASIGALTGVVSGAIIGAIVGAIISDMGSVSLLEIFGRIEPYSISIRVIAIPIRALVKILGPITKVITAIIGFITSKKTAVFRVLGAIIGAFTGAFAGVIGGAFVGIIIAGFTAGLFSICYYCIEGLGLGTTLLGGAILAIGSFFPEFRRQVVVPVIKDIGKIVDLAVLFILAGTVTAMILTTICSLAGSYFITSALIGKFGPYVSDFVGKVIAFSESITGDLNIASSGFTGGLVGGIIAGIYRINVRNGLLVAVTEFEVYALGAVGAVTGFIFARIDKAIGDTLLQIVWIPIGGAALGAFSGLIGGVILIISKVAMSLLADIAIANIGDKVATITAVIGGFVGGAIGGYFTSSMIFAGLIGIAFSTTSVVIFAAIICMIKRYHIQRGIHIPLKDIIANFGKVITDRGGAANKNLVQYKINLYKTKQE